MLKQDAVREVVRTYTPLSLDAVKVDIRLGGWNGD